ncbi:MAG TPA: hypothetical protein VFW11_09720 [Cyclobacteriaceae bacterium]|nr:hypothetical protein [Cyclobacteriaceae bacterium]
MKKSFRFPQLIGTVLLILSAITIYAQKGDAMAKDIRSIKALIEKETKAFFEIDRETWSDCWAHVPYAFWSFADTTDVNSFSGWEAINMGFADYFTSSKPSTAEIEREWLDVKVFGNGAYARFNQKVNDQDISRDKQAEVRVLEKVDGKWKIILVGVIASKNPVIVN